MTNKTFREILAEKDEEFTYHIKSTADIHRPELFERVRHALMPYRIKSITAEGYMPITKDNKTFPDQPNSPTYVIKVITGLPIDTKSALEMVAMTCHIHIAHLYMAPEDDVASYLSGKPVEVDSTTSQLLVGTKRIDAFMQELQKDRKEREKKAITREVYESFFTTHRALASVVKKPLRNGYYMVEMIQEGDDRFMRSEGPFETRPDGNPYRDHTGIRSAKIVSETDAGDMYGVEVMVEEMMPSNAGELMFEVGVADMNLGRRYTSIVRASSPEIAREIAVRQVAETHKIDPSTLTAMAPRQK